MEQLKIRINDHEVIALAGQTILEVVIANRLDQIPTLCHDNRLEHYTSCYLCVVEVEGFNKLIPACSTNIYNGMKIWTNTEKVVSARKTALELLMSNHYADCIGPCRNNCPAGVDAQAYIALISMGKFKEALKLVKENNPFPMSIGRVCIRDCEAACRRKFIDEPVGINLLKRFIADYDNINKWTPELSPPRAEKIAVIGGGPAGLSCAYYLRIKGFKVTIFEKLPKLGGMLRYGIPEYRLPKKILDSEIEWIVNLGVNVHTGVEFGKDIFTKQLLDDFKAIFLSVGADKPSCLGLEGEDTVSGIFRGTEFLRAIAMGQGPALKGTVIVVGGGNTAIDAARTALRCGAERVKIVYRRSINEMPANHDEIEAAQSEGIEILFLTNPKSLIMLNGKLTGLECLKMQLETNPGGRPRPVPIGGSEFVLNCENLIGAIGQNVDTDFLRSDAQFSMEKWGTVKVNKETLETSIPGVFAGGDVVTGPLTAISSIAQGKKAALSIIEYIENGKACGHNGKFFSLKTTLSNISEHELEHNVCMPKVKSQELPVNERIHCFDEMDLGIDSTQVKWEVKRCLECGCSEYYDCKLRKYCDEYKISINDYIGETRKYKIDGRHPFISLDPNKCINCGKCVRTCSEILKISALGFVYRGFRAIVKPAMEKALIETNCISCGNCIDACPTGAISEKYPFKILGTLPKENFETVCSFCSLGCKINFKKISNEIFYVANTTDSIKNTHNKGYLCTKGRFGHRYLFNGSRILDASIRQHGKIQTITLENAIKYTADKLKNIISTYGKESVAVLASPNLSNEELYLLQKFVRAGFKNNNISSFSSMLYGQEQDSLDEMMGFTTSTVKSERLKYADLIIVVNSNLSEENLVMELKVKEALKKKAKLVLISSAEIRLARQADLWIDARKGTTTFLFDSIIKYMIDYNCIDNSYIEERTGNFDKLKDQVKSSSIQQAAETTGVEREKIESLIRLISDKAKNIIFIYNTDTKTDRSVNDLKAIGNFLLATGRIMKEDNGIIILREHSNSVGAMEMGAQPNYLPGYIGFDHPDEIGLIGRLWGVNLENIFKPVDLLRKIKTGDIKALLVFGEDPLILQDNIVYLNNIEFLGVSDAFKSNLAEHADVVFPASSYIEQEGTFINCDNQVQKGVKITESVLPMPNWQIISKLASSFYPGFDYNSVEDIFEEIKRTDRFFSINEEEINNRFEPYFNNGFKNKKLLFLNYPIDFSVFDAIKPYIHFQEDYYLYNIRKKIT